MYMHEKDLYIEREDQCYLCANKKKCPLIEAISVGFVELAMFDYVDKCKMYKVHRVLEKSSKLKICRDSIET